MTLYEKIKMLKDKDLFASMVKSGMVSCVYLNYYKIYENYIKLKKKGHSKMDSYVLLSEDVGMSEKSIRTIVKKMEEIH